MNQLVYNEVIKSYDLHTIKFVKDECLKIYFILFTEKT